MMLSYQCQCQWGDYFIICKKQTMPFWDYCAFHFWIADFPCHLSKHLLQPVHFTYVQETFKGLLFGGLILKPGHISSLSVPIVSSGGLSIEGAGRPPYLSQMKKKKKGLMLNKWRNTWKCKYIIQTMSTVCKNLFSHIYHVSCEEKNNLNSER